MNYPWDSAPQKLTVTAAYGSASITVMVPHAALAYSLLPLVRSILCLKLAPLR